MWWLLIVVVLAGGGVLLGSWVRSRGLSVRWYEWLLAAVGLLLAALAIQSYTGSLAELEPHAAGLFLAFFGIPALIFAAVPVGLIWKRSARA
jgi:hypothetical protein